MAKYSYELKRKWQKLIKWVKTDILIFLKNQRELFIVSE